MKLLLFYIITTYSNFGLWAQKVEDDHNSFLPQYQSPRPMFASDSSLYLPLEPHTAIPYYAMKNTNKLPFQYLPPTGTKAPASFPTSFPMMMSSSIGPNFEDDDTDDEPNNRHENKRPIPSPQSPPQYNRLNGTQRTMNRNEPERRETRQSVRTINYEHPIDRIDVKPQHFPMNGGVPSQSSGNQAPATQRPIISVDSLGHRSDHGPELIKAGSFQNAQYFHAPGVFISSSTTEPAIPIIRLSNEMDLDGSFSYEALGADQTHYVQHSRMENMGTDKEEQVVEGSYSYIGDNGQTYTVHYIADSNGFRASGDHLPVAPPIPEIIQRAVQHNLAEEARKPPHLKSWQDNDKNYEAEGEIIQRNPAPPQRNLFTGRNPEAFSYSFSPGNTQNNLVAAASSQPPVRTIEFPKDQTQVKPNNGPISPQITFLASQGAHVPSLNTPPQSIARVFTTEKSNMPQLMNYEAAAKEADQENNKALWRWQYGINSNMYNENANKNAISRSSGDEIMINFNDMTPEQYTSMIHSQLDPNNEINGNQLQFEEQRANEITTQKITKKYETNIPSEYHNPATNTNYGEIPNQEMSQNHNKPHLEHYENQNQISNQEMTQNNNTPNSEYYQSAYHNNDIKMENQNINSQSTLNEVSPAPATENYPAQAEWLQSMAKTNRPVIEQTKSVESYAPSYHSSKLLTQQDFIPPSQTVTKSYDYEDDFYESKKIGDVNTSIRYGTVNSSPSPTYPSISTIGHVARVITMSTTEQPPHFSTLANIRFIDFVKPDETKFRPILTENIEEHMLHDTTTIATTTETSVEDILENNIFLKNLVRTKNTEENNANHNNIDKEPIIQHHPKIIAEPKVEKVQKLIQYQTNMLNDIKAYRKKTMDLSDIVSFVAQKNQFESNKVKPRNKPHSNTNQSNKLMYIPTYQEQATEDQENEERNKANLRPLNHQQQEELRGIIKNYKILQRNNNKIRNEEDRMNQLRRDLSPPPVKMLHSPNLPPLGRAGPSMKSYLPPVFV